MANPFVSTIISTAPVGASTAGFGVPAAISYNCSGWGSTRVRTYAGVDEVLEDFPSTTGPECRWAAAVFGQSQRPPLVAILRGALPPTQVYTIRSGASFAAGLTYELTAAGDGVTETDISVTLPSADIVVASASIVNATETWTSAAHGMTTGDGPYRVTTSNTIPTGLAIDTDYWVIAPTSGTFLLASSKANALALTPINITSDGVGNQTLVRTSNDVLMAQLKQALNLVAGKNFTAVQTTGALDTDYLTVTASGAGEWFSLAVADVTLLGTAQTHVDPGVATDLAAIALDATGWYALETFYNSQAYVLAAAAWIESADPRRIYHAGTDDSLALTQAVGTGGYDVIDRLKTQAYARTSGWYHPSSAEMLTGALAGRVLPLNPGSVAAAHKPLTGVAAVAMTSTQRANLLAKYGNSYSSFETGTAATFVGKTASGEWWDVVRNDDSVNDDMRVSLYNLLYQNDIIPGDDGGITQVASVVEAVLDRAVKARIYTAPNVVVPLFSAVSAANKAARRLPISWAATRVGAVVYIDATGTVS